MTATDAPHVQAPIAINKAATAFVAHGPTKLLIDGKWIASRSGETFETIDPASGDRLTDVALGDASDVDAAVAAARRAFETGWADVSPYERARHLLRIADLIEANAEELGTIQTYDMGMTVSQAIDMARHVPEIFRYYAGWVTKITGQTFPRRGGNLSYTVREPLGVVGAIIPWNGPVQASAWKIAPTLACGNTVVFKPAKEAPLVSIRLAELIQEAGLPDGVFNMVTGQGEGAGEAMIRHPDIDMIAFTGSTGVGRQIVAASADRFQRLSLEMGGKSPTIIFPDADLEKAAATAAMGFCIASGQGCVAGTRVLIHADVYDEVSRRIIEAASGFKVGSPFSPDTFVTPIISPKQLATIEGYIEAGRAAGATVSTGGSRIDRPGNWIEPTVFTDVGPDMTIVREEIFGPVGALMPFSDLDDAVRLANGVDYGLSASIWSRDMATTQTLASRIQAGIVWVNTIFELDMMSPFGGWKQSGVGKELGPDPIEEYTRGKTVVLRYGDDAAT